MARHTRALLTFLLLLLLCVSLSGCAVGDTNLTNLVLSGDLTVGDDATVTDDLTVTGDQIASTWMRLTPQTAISVTMNGYITPTGTLQRLESAGNVGTSKLAVSTAGDILYLQNTSNTTITISDTGVLKLSSNLALGQYDGVILYCDGTNWIEHGDN